MKQNWRTQYILIRKYNNHGQKISYQYSYSLLDNTSNRNRDSTSYGDKDIFC